MKPSRSQALIHSVWCQVCWCLDCVGENRCPCGKKASYYWQDQISKVIQVKFVLRSDCRPAELACEIGPAELWHEVMAAMLLGETPSQILEHPAICSNSTARFFTIEKNIGDMQSHDWNPMAFVPFKKLWPMVFGFI